MDINDYSFSAPPQAPPQEAAPAAPEDAPPAPEDAPGKKKKEKTLKQQLTSFGVGLVVLCFVMSLLAGVGGAFAVMRFYPSVNRSGDETTGLGEGAVHELPAPSAENAGSENEPAGEQPGELTTAAPEAGTGEEAQARTRGEIYAGAVNSIVGIRAVCTRQVQGFFGMSVPQTVTSSGSGFFVTSNGYVVTNYHVVENANEITVSTYDGSTYPALVRGYEEANDIAVLKVSGDFTPAELGSSADLQVGDDILVIGNPLGNLSYTFTDGVVSYLNRMITGDTGTTINMFQTNAAINEGNSGGPVYDMNGRVVGIASAKYTASAVEGLGFCIPIDDVRGMISDIIETGYVTGKPVLGVSVQTVSPAMAARYGIVVGCYVVEVGEGTAADNAGILAADVITAVDGAAVSAAGDMSALLLHKKAGETADIRVNRAGTELIFTVTLGEYAPAAARTQYSNVYDF